MSFANGSAAVADATGTVAVDLALQAQSDADIAVTSATANVQAGGDAAAGFALVGGSTINVLSGATVLQVAGSSTASTNVQYEFTTGPYVEQLTGTFAGLDDTSVPQAFYVVEINGNAVQVPLQLVLVSAAGGAPSVAGTPAPGPAFSFPAIGGGGVARILPALPTVAEYDAQATEYYTDVSFQTDSQNPVVSTMRASIVASLKDAAAAEVPANFFDVYHVTTDGSGATAFVPLAAGGEASATVDAADGSLTTVRILLVAAPDAVATHPTPRIGVDGSGNSNLDIVVEAAYDVGGDLFVPQVTTLTPLDARVVSTVMEMGVLQPFGRSAGASSTDPGSWEFLPAPGSVVPLRWRMQLMPFAAGTTRRATLVLPAVALLTEPQLVSPFTTNGSNQRLCTGTVTPDGVATFLASVALSSATATYLTSLAPEEVHVVAVPGATPGAAPVREDVVSTTPAAAVNAQSRELVITDASAEYLDDQSSAPGRLEDFINTAPTVSVDFTNPNAVTVGNKVGSFPVRVRANAASLRPFELLKTGATQSELEVRLEQGGFPAVGAGWVPSAASNVDVFNNLSRVASADISPTVVPLRFIFTNVSEDRQGAEVVVSTSDVFVAEPGTSTPNALAVTIQGGSLAPVRIFSDPPPPSNAQEVRTQLQGGSEAAKAAVVVDFVQRVAVQDAPEPSSRESIVDDLVTFTQASAAEISEEALDTIADLVSKGEGTPLKILTTADRQQSDTGKVRKKLGRRPKVKRSPVSL